MLTHLLNLLFIASTLAASTTYNLSTDGTNWLIAGLNGPNPTLNAFVGDVLIFDVTGLSSTLFAIHHKLGSTDLLDRVPTSPASLTGSGSLTLMIDAGYGGMILYYADEANPTLVGRICISLDHCTTMASCGGACTACDSGWTLTVGGTCGMNAGITCPSPLPVANCATASCWMTAAGVQVQCNSCNSGFWVNANLTCNACSGNCKLGEYISALCGGFNDRVCSNCSSCPAGFVLNAACPGNGTTDDTSCVSNSTSPPAMNPPPSTTPPSGNPPSNPPPAMNPPPSSNSTCQPPANCKTASCWSPTDTQCTECNSGFFIDNSRNDSCSPCSSCSADKYVSWPCEGYTDTVCSACYSTACHPCQVGYTMDLYGLCVPQLCLLYGCGAANIDVTCREYDSRHFACVCPGEVVSIIAVNSTAFAGCRSSGSGSGSGSGGNNPLPPPVEEVIADVNATHLEAFLVNGMEQILGAALITVNGNSFTLNITATVPIDGLTAELRKEIAKFLGGSFTADDITIDYIGKKRQTSSGQVGVTVQGQSSSASSLMPFASLVLGLAAFLSLF